ncbi:DedA family protein [Pseudonocardia sp. GCM10023141]|uniref:DedA family protein n=1 Tax=Pseudonocardia sp. GCM10023141 TaxID=3252653 RepID=UPI00361D0DA0
MLDAIRLLLENAMASPWLLLVIVGIATIDALLPVVPAEALIIAAGVASAAGTQNLATVIGAAALGAFIGEVGAYLIGRSFGPALQRRLVPGTARATTFTHVEQTLATSGGLILLTARYIPAGRTIAALAAGATGFSPVRYVAYSALGATMSATYVAMLGYLGGATFANDPLVALLFSLGVGTAITLAVGFTRRHRAATERTARNHERIDTPTSAGH